MSTIKERSARGAEDALVNRTQRFAVAYSGLFAQWFRGLTINAHERLALAHLWEHGPMTMSSLGARIPLSRAAITALTDRLEAVGYVARTPDDHDRRRTMLSLTEVPGQLAAPMMDAWSSDVEELETSFSPAAREAITRWLDELAEISHRHAEALRGRSEAEISGPPSLA